jgi:hypothetical protein
MAEENEDLARLLDGNITSIISLARAHELREQAENQIAAAERLTEEAHETLARFREAVEQIRESSAPEKVFSPGLCRHGCGRKKQNNPGDDEHDKNCRSDQIRAEIDREKDAARIVVLRERLAQQQNTDRYRGD